MTWSHWLTIWALHVAVLLIPGANVLLIAHLGASAGRRSAVWAALGVCAITLFWSSSAVLGVHALFELFPTARRVLQAAGALYLLYIAWRLWRSGSATARASGPAPAMADGRAFRLGMLTNLSNPKSALFFGSVFSTALPPHPGAAVLAGAVALVVVNALAWHLLLAVLASAPQVQAGYAAQQGRLSRAAGAIVGAFGLSLLAATVREARR